MRWDDDSVAGVTVARPELGTERKGQPFKNPGGFLAGGGILCWL